MKFIAFSALASLAVVGCGSSADSPDGTPATASSTGTVRGALATSSFGSTPTGVVAVDETGARVAGKLAADGNFTLTLPKDHTYRLMVILGSASEPIVFPRASGKLDTTFRIAGGGAAAALGTVRHFAAAPAAGFNQVGTSQQLLSSDAPGSDPADPADDAEGADGECVDGKDQGTGAACVDDDAKTTCDAGDGDGETNDDGDAKDTPDDQADGECENGVDAKTGAACTDPPEADGEGTDSDDADPTQPMAIPEHNAPDEIAGCQSEAEDGPDGKDGAEKDD